MEFCQVCQVLERKSRHGDQKRDLAMAFQVLRAASASGELVGFLALVVVVELADPPIG